jgi:uncharacterized protein
MKYWVIVGFVSALVQVASGGMVISEWMYAGTNGEFVEFTNVGSDPVDMTNWSYSDTDAEPGDVAFLDVFGVVQPGESVILTEAVPSTFRSAWGLADSLKVFGPNADSNLGRNDQINLYDADLNLVDQLSFGDQTYPGTPRTQNRSCNIPATDYDYTVAQTTWFLASWGDEYGSWTSSGYDVGSPGVVPEPGALALFALGGLVMARRRN